MSEKKLGIQISNAAIYSNSFKSVAPCGDSTGLLTNEFIYRGLSFRPSGIRMAEEFIINSRIHRSDVAMSLSIENYFTDPSVAMLAMAGSASYRNADEIDLPDPTVIRLSLEECIGRRRSCRNYSGDAIELDNLVSLVHSAAKVTAKVDVNMLTGDLATLEFRSTPSGGGLYPVDLYILALKINDLEPGLYKYDAKNNKLIVEARADRIPSLLQGFDSVNVESVLENIAGIFLFIGSPWRSMRKYGARGMRFLLMEAGAMAEHINLAAIGLGLGSTDWSSYYDDEVNDALGIDGVHTTIVHSILFGYPG